MFPGDAVLGNRKVAQRKIILRLDAGQVDANDQLAIRDKGFEGGVKHPSACSVAHPAAEPPLKQLVDIPVEAIETPKASETTPAVPCSSSDVTSYWVDCFGFRSS
jgi:hypothetical protein